jgi:hypothetical protein
MDKKQAYTTATLSNVSGRVYNGTNERKQMINFDNVINEEAIAKLTDEQAEALLKILEEAGY